MTNTTIKSCCTLVFTTAVLCAALYAPGVLAQSSGPTVTTDRQDYPPFSTVDITGAGFQPGETISNQVVQIAGPAAGTVYDPWEAVADNNGNFVTTWYVFTDELLNTTLQLTSTGESSGLKAQTTFTDAAADMELVSLSDSPDPVLAGANITYTLTVTNNGGNQATDPKVTNSIPIGATFVSETHSSPWTLQSAPTVGGTGQVIWSFSGNLHQNSGGLFTLVVKVNCTDPNNSTVSDTASTGSSDSDPNTANNSKTTTTTVNNPAPSISCPPPVTVQCASAVPAHATDLASFVALGGSASDTCGAVTVAWVSDVVSAQTCANRFTITRTYKATDVAGGSSTCAQTITVNDTIGPTITDFPANTTVSCASSVPAANDASVTATDNCSGSVSITHDADVISAQTCPNRYTITRTYHATDSCGNVTSRSQSITVDDETAPVLAGVPGNATAECSAVPLPGSPTATDNCDPAPTVTLSTISTQDPDTTHLAHYSYTITRTWTATDACGNHSSQTQVVTVHDTTAPVLSGQGPALTIQCPASPVFTAPTANDNCDPDPVISFADATTPGGCAGAYTITRTWTAKDVSGNVSLPVSQSITVEDLTAPTLAGVPADATVECSSVPAAATPTASDTCDPHPTVTLAETSTQDPDATHLAHYSYTITRTWTATDACGNHSSQTQVVTVHDTTAPVLSGQGPALTIQCPASPVFTAPTANDNCDPNPVISFTDATTPGGCAGAYTITRTWTAKDVSGNVSLPVSQSITVEDLTAPTLAGVPADATVECSSVPAAATPTASDTCDPHPTVTLAETSTQDPDATHLAHYSYTITRTWTATDACGNHSSQTQVVTVHDTTAPVLSGQGPALTIQCPASPVFTAPTANDNCDPNPVISFTDATTPGGCAGAYTITRTWTAKDVSGNVSLPVSQSITVEDLTAPTLAGVPADATVECSSVPAAATPTASDTCDPHPTVTLAETSTQDPDATHLAHYSYTITRTWTATDACGNHSSQTQVVTVHDTTAPVLSGQGPALTIQCPASPVFTAPTANDNCDPNPVISFTDATTPGGCAGAYTITRTWTAKDVSGNVSLPVSQSITVEDLTAPTLAGVPADATVECSSVPAAATPTASDTCDPHPTVTLAETSTQDPDATHLAHYSYTITRTWTATDACGNHSSQTQVVTVHDTTAPVLSGQGPALTIQCPASPVFTAPTANDNCDPNPVISFTDATTPGGCAGAYTITRTWTAKDVSGNVSLPVSQSITVEDLTAPTLAGVPADATVECSSVPAAASPTASDTCDPHPTVTLAETSTQDPDATHLAHYSYTITRTWTATDACGNHSSQTQVVTVHDTTAPVLSGQGPALTIQCPASPVFTAPTANDNCDPNPVISFTDATTPGGCAGAYTITRTWTAKDVSGNVSLPVSQSITVEDLTAPTLAGVPADATVECSSVPAAASPTASDTCDPHPTVTLAETSTQDPDATHLAHYSYTITRTWTATDACGNHSSQTQVVTVHDTTAPVLSGQGPALTIQCPASPVFTAPTANDNCDPNPVISFTDATTPGGCAGAYTITRTWTAKDVSGNVSLPVSQSITVEDLTAPTLAGVPADATVECSSVPAAATPTASDTCDPHPTVTLAETSTQDPDATHLAHYSYTITRTWTATDACGNHSSQTQVVTVHDTTAPVLSGQGPALTIQCPASPVFTAPTANDNCDPNPVISFTDATTPGGCAGAYTITRTWTAKDVSGNVSLPVSQSITVEDLTAPTLAGVPADATVECSSVPAAATPTASDTCDPHPTVTLAETSTQDPDATHLAHYSYTITRTWTATDACGNHSSQTQVVTVHDTTAPVLSGQGPALTIQCPASPVFTAPTANDNCDPNPVISFTDATTPGGCAGAYTITRTWTAKDVSGNVSLPVSQSITVEDLTAPTLAGVPADATVECSSVPAAASPTASDTCDPHPTVTLAETSTQDPDATHLAHYSYTITRTWTATDACGNHSSQTQVVTVHDTTAPVLSGQGPALTIQCPASPVFTAPTANDNCDPNPVISFTDATTPGGCAGAYTITRTWTAKDVSGNVSLPVSQSITVEDLTAPTLAGVPADATVECSSVPAAATPTASDTCDPHPTVTLAETSTQDPDATHLAHYSYTITRTWTATDACGNHSSQTQVVTVHDTTAPVLSGQGPALTIQCPASPVFTAPTANDNCDPNPVISFTDATTPGGCAGAYTITRTWTAKDVSGNVSLPVSQSITVEDTTPPAITGFPADTTVSCAGAVPAANNSLVTAVDGCGGTVTLSHDADAISAQTCANRYTITRTYHATDACGNIASRSQTITVNDTTPPTLTKGSFAACYPTASAATAAAVAATTASDNCGGIVTLTATVSGTCSATVTVTGTDLCGNPATVTYNTRIDNTPPVLSGTPASTASYECYSSVPAAAPVTANDNCDGAVSVSFSETQTHPSSSCNNTITRTWAASDTCGNVASFTQTITVNDDTLPSINLTGVATMTPYYLGAFVDPGVTVSDNCVSLTVTTNVAIWVNNTWQPVAAVNTGVPGLYQITYTLTDACGNHAIATRAVNAQFKPLNVSCNGTMGHTILPPINPDGSSVCKQGSTVPAKFQVFDANCNSVGTPGLVTSFALVQINGNPVSGVNEIVDSTTPDNAFRWTGDQWIFNISTKSLAKNKTYVYLITLNDGSTIQFQFGLK